MKNKPTDSAAAGTAMSTGSKTYNGILGFGAEGQRLTTSGEVAMATGRKLGLVTSVPFNHATPAAFIAHNQDRNDYTGLASEMLYSGADVLMGGGHPRYTDDHVERDADYTWIDAGDYSSLIGGKTPFTFVEERGDFEALANCEVPAGGKVFGLAQVAETLQERRAGGTANDVELGVTPLNDVPSLATMTEGALNTLSKDSKGFFLMVEGGAVDWAGHSNYMNHLIEEQTDFNDSFNAVSKWVEENSSWDETLVIVTADHETGYLAGVGANPKWTPMAGEANKIPTASWHSGNHTNALVPFFVKGAGAERFIAAADETDSVRGKYLDNTELGTIVKTLMNEAPVAGSAPITDRCAAQEPAPAPEPAPAEQQGAAPAPEQGQSSAPADAQPDSAATSGESGAKGSSGAAATTASAKGSAPKASTGLASTGSDAQDLGIAAALLVLAGAGVLIGRRALADR